MAMHYPVPDEKPRPPNCPTCDSRLHVHAHGTEPNAAGQPETVQIYMCYQHGFFTHTKSNGLVPGLKTTLV
jgi:hypothetical protein